RLRAALDRWRYAMRRIAVFLFAVLLGLAASVPSLADPSPWKVQLKFDSTLPGSDTFDVTVSSSVVLQVERHSMPFVSSGNSGTPLSGNSAHLKPGSDRLPPAAGVDQPRRRREAKEDDRSHVQASSSGTVGRGQDCGPDRRGDGPVAAHRETDQKGATDHGSGRSVDGAGARRGTAKRERTLARVSRRSSRN